MLVCSSEVGSCCLGISEVSVLGTWSPQVHSLNSCSSNSSSESQRKQTYVIKVSDWVSCVMWLPIVDAQSPLNPQEAVHTLSVLMSLSTECGEARWRWVAVSSDTLQKLAHTAAGLEGWSENERRKKKRICGTSSGWKLARAVNELTLWFLIKFWWFIRQTTLREHFALPNYEP